MANPHPNGYLAEPTAGKASPVLVLHAWWGLNHTTRTVCDRLAAAGYTAFAPDLYRGAVTDTIAGAETLSGALFEDLEQARADCNASAVFLKNLGGTGGGTLAVIGFSLGAFFALDLSTRAPDLVRAVVAYYGTCPGDYSRSKAAYLGHFAEQDDFEPQSEVEALESAIRQAGRPVAFHTYPGTGHWFFEPDRTDAYNQGAADLSWQRTLAFLRPG